MKKKFILLFINIILNLSKNLNKKFFKNLFRCSENKQRKEKTQTMKKILSYFFIRFIYFGGLTTSSNSDKLDWVSMVKVFTDVVSLIFLFFWIIFRVVTSSLLKILSFCLHDTNKTLNTPIEKRTVFFITNFFTNVSWKFIYKQIFQLSFHKELLLFYKNYDKF